MLYVFIDGFPNVLERCLNNVETGRIAIHLLCTYLSSFVALFSVYYHRVKILTVNTSVISSPLEISRLYYFLQNVKLNDFVISIG